MQRCGAHLASKADVEEAFKAGAAAVKYAVNGKTDKMVILKRDMNSGKYKCKVYLYYFYSITSFLRRLS